MIKFQGSKFRIMEDSEGEVKLTLVIPASDAPQVLEIPTQTRLVITVEPQDENGNGD